MRKKYIGWWIASAWFFFICLRVIYELIFFPDPNDVIVRPVLFLFLALAGLFFYLGYRRFQEYKEYQEDRQIRNEYYKSNTKRDE